MTLKRVGAYPIQSQTDHPIGLLDQTVFTVRSIHEAVWEGAIQPVTAVPSSFELLFLLEGKGVFSQRDHRSEAHAGDLVLLSQFTPYTLSPAEGKPLRCLSIHFLLAPSHLERVFERLCHSRSGLAASTGDPEAVRCLMAMAHRLWQDGAPGAMALGQAVLHALLPEMIGPEADIQRELCTPAQAELIGRAVQLADEGLTGPVRIQLLVRELGVSESRLNKTFNDVLGVPPSRYFMNMKMRRVEELVALTDRTMEEIAAGMGFSSAFHLSRAYKDTFGISPSQFRKQWRMGIVK